MFCIFWPKLKYHKLLLQIEERCNFFFRFFSLFRMSTFNHEWKCEGARFRPIFVMMNIHRKRSMLPRHASPMTSPLLHRLDRFWPSNFEFHNRDFVVVVQICAQTFRWKLFRRREDERTCVKAPRPFAQFEGSSKRERTTVSHCRNPPPMRLLRAVYSYPQSTLSVISLYYCIFSV